MSTRGKQVVGAIIVLVILIGVGSYFLIRPKPLTKLQVVMTQGLQEAVDSIGPIMKQKNVEIVYQEGRSTESLTKAMAQKDKPIISVFALDETSFLQGKNAGLWATFDRSKMPNLDKLIKGALDPDLMGAAFELYIQGLIYNVEVYKQMGWSPPKSWFDLWDPKLKGRVAFPSIAASGFALDMFVGINRVLGGDERKSKSLDLAFKKFGELIPNLHSITSGATQVYPLLLNKEIYASGGGTYLTLMRIDKGVPIEWIAPQEGGVVGVDYVAIAKNAPHMEEAMQFVNLILGNEFQLKNWEKSRNGSVNRETANSMDSTQRERYLKYYGQEILEQGMFLDRHIVAENRRDWNDRWSREIEKKQ